MVSSTTYLMVILFHWMPWLGCVLACGTPLNKLEIMGHRIALFDSEESDSNVLISISTYFLAILRSLI